MYQASIIFANTSTLIPVTTETAALIAAHALGATQLEPVDAEQGIWLFDLNEYFETRLEQEGHLNIEMYGMSIEIELP